MPKRKLTPSQIKTEAAKQRQLNPSKDRREFSSKCTALRIMLGMTQVKFAAKMRVSIRSIERWERFGHHMPHGKVLERFEKLYEKVMEKTA